MRMSSFGNMPEQWNQAKGYLDIGEYLWKRYYDASMSPGFGDDVETFKRLIDHYSCKFRAKQARILTNANKPLLTSYMRDNPKCERGLMEWFLLKISEIEAIGFDSMKKRSEGQTSNNLLMKESEAKKRLRELSRELHLINELLGLYDVERAFQPKSLTDDIK